MSIKFSIAKFSNCLEMSIQVDQFLQNTINSKKIKHIHDKFITNYGTVFIIYHCVSCDKVQIKEEEIEFVLLVELHTFGCFYIV